MSAFITGGADGIGAELAKVMVGLGYAVSIVDKDVAKSERLVRWHPSPMHLVSEKGRDFSPSLIPILELISPSIGDVLDAIP